mgnify:CR=1 FL=1
MALNFFARRVPCRSFQTSAFAIAPSPAPYSLPLSASAPIVLHGRPGGTVGTCRHGVARDHLAELVRSVHRAAADHAVRHALRDPRCARAPLSRAQDGPEPRGVVAGEPGRQDLRVQAASGIEVPQRRPADDGRREVQLRALQGRVGEGPAGARRAGRDRRSPGGALSSQGAVARLHDVLRHDRQRRRHHRAEEISARRSETTASRSIRSAPAPTSSSATSRAWRSSWRPTPATGAACRT